MGAFSRDDDDPAALAPTGGTSATPGASTTPPTDPADTPEDTSSPEAGGTTAPDSGASEDPAPDDGTASPDDPGASATADSPGGEGSTPPGEPGDGGGDYCTLVAQSDEALRAIEVDPNDLPAMAESIQPYVDALTAARAVAPEETQASLDTILEYWNPLLEAVRNPFTAAGGLASSETTEQYSEAMVQWYTLNSSLCASQE
jgi:hypothetical protein